MKNIDRYIEKCFKEAAENEGRTLESTDYEWQYYIYNDKEIAIALWCKYKRILSRVEYRLKRNIEKNFGLTMTSNMEYPEAQGYDPNFSVCHAEITLKNGKKKRVWISHVRDEDHLGLSESNPKSPYTLILELSKKKELISSEDDFYKNISWSRFKELWMELYGENKFKNLAIKTSSNIKILE